MYILIAFVEEFTFNIFLQHIFMNKFEHANSHKTLPQRKIIKIIIQY